jgi:hypothetical protein
MIPPIAPAVKPLGVVGMLRQRRNSKAVDALERWPALDHRVLYGFYDDLMASRAAAARALHDGVMV